MTEQKLQTDMEDLKNQMETRAAEDRERLEKFESMQKKGGFGSASASTASSTTEEIIDVTIATPADGPSLGVAPSGT